MSEWRDSDVDPFVFDGWDGAFRARGVGRSTIDKTMRELSSQLDFLALRLQFSDGS